MLEAIMAVWEEKWEGGFLVLREKVHCVFYPLLHLFDDDDDDDDDDDHDVYKSKFYSNLRSSLKGKRRHKR